MNPSSSLKQNKSKAHEIIIKVLKQQQQRYNFHCDYSSFIIDMLIFSKSSHIVSVFKDHMIYDYLGEFLQQLYSLENSKEKIKYFPTFYKAYLKFFCHPTLNNMAANEIIHKVGEAHAEIYYAAEYGKNIQEELNAIHINNNNEDPHNKEDQMIFNNLIMDKLQKNYIETISNHEKKQDSLLYSNHETLINDIEDLATNSNNNSLRSIMKEIIDEEQDFHIKQEKKENNQIEEQNIMKVINIKGNEKKLNLIADINSCRKNNNKHTINKQADKNDKKSSPNKIITNKLNQLKNKSRNLTKNIYSKTYEISLNKCFGKQTKHANIQLHSTLHFKSNRNNSTIARNTKYKPSSNKTYNEIIKQKPKSLQPFNMKPMSLHDYPITNKEELKKLTLALVYENSKYSKNFLNQSIKMKANSDLNYNSPIDNILTSKKLMKLSKKDFNKKMPSGKVVCSIYHVGTKKKIKEKSLKSKEDENQNIGFLTKNSSTKTRNSYNFIHNNNLFPLSNKNEKTNQCILLKRANQINYSSTSNDNYTNQNPKVIFTSKHCIQSISYIKRNIPECKK